MSVFIHFERKTCKTRHVFSKRKKELVKPCQFSDISKQKCWKHDTFLATAKKKWWKTCQFSYISKHKCWKHDTFFTTSLKKWWKTCQFSYISKQKCWKHDTFFTTSFLQLLKPLTFCNFAFPNVQNTTRFLSLPFHFLWNAARFDRFCSEMSKNRHVFPHFAGPNCPKKA